MKYLFEDSDIVPGQAVESQEGKVAVIMCKQGTDLFYLAFLDGNFLVENYLSDMADFLNAHQYTPAKIKYEIVG